MAGRNPGVVLVTGASSGIGRACALHLAQRGFHVFAASRRPASEFAAQLGPLLPPSSLLDAVTMDVNADASVRSAVAHIEAKAGRLDAVVNCAGFGIGGAIEDTADEEALRILETNLLGTLRVCRATLPILRRQGRGTLVLVSSIGGRMGLPFQGLYSATKFGVEGLAESLSMEVRGLGVRVALIEPGDFRTGFTDRRTRVRASNEGSAYREAFDRALAVIESDERGGSTPEPIARLVERILRSSRPRLRYTIGPLPERLAVRLKSLLPGRAFESLLRLYYRLDATRSTRGSRVSGGQSG
jgi:NAD(P)-dependent dehydrogenase (short-subunit alcohol dehydrogenase family)